MTYTIHSISFWRFFLTALTPICLFLVFDKPNGVVSASFLFAVIIIVISFLWLPRFTATAVAEVNIEDEAKVAIHSRGKMRVNAPENYRRLEEERYHLVLSTE